MKRVSFFFFLFSLVGLGAPSGTVHHPIPKEPIYLQPALYENFKKQLVPPPTAGSEEQKQDEAALAKAQKERSQKDCDRANSEVFVSLASFFGPTYALLDQASTEKLTPFFEQVRNDGDFFIQKLKVDFPRQRPFAYLSSVTPCVPKEVTGAYPSGHAVLARLYSLILSDFYPAKRKQIERRADQIGQDRVLSGMHHPSDVYNGQKMGELVYHELKKSPAFRKAYQAQKASLNK